jgi:D-xylose transport system substrate-binding protein
MHRATGRLRLVLVALVAVSVVMAACSDNKKKSTASTTGTTAAGGASGTIALLLPETKTARYEAADRPLIEAKIRELCAGCKVLYSNADQDAAKQQQQAEAALTNGAKVLILDPVDSAAAATIVAKAKAQKVPVISYDRLIKNADVDYYVSFDNVKVGRLQAQALVDKLKAEGKAGSTIVMINGSPTDNNAALFKQGAHSVIDTSGLKVGKEYDTPDWSPDQAQREMEQALTALGKDKIAGVYAANDGTAGGAIAAMKGAGLKPIPPTTGQDAELAGVQRIVAGEQYMTVYKAIKPEADATGTLAVDLLHGTTPPSGTVNGSTPNGQKSVPSVLLEPVAVTLANLKDTVVKDGFQKVTDICTAQYAAACKSAGLT